MRPSRRGYHPDNVAFHDPGPVRLSATEIDADGVELVLDAHALVGEGPLWDDASGTLVWVDIMANAVHRFDPSTNRDQVTDVGQPVGAAGLRR